MPDQELAHSISELRLLKQQHQNEGSTPPPPSLSSEVPGSNPNGTKPTSFLRQALLATSSRSFSRLRHSSTTSMSKLQSATNVTNAMDHEQVSFTTYVTFTWTMPEKTIQNHSQQL